MAVLSASTSSVPKRSIMTSSGKSQNLLRTRRNFQNSLRNDIVSSIRRPGTPAEIFSLRQAGSGGSSLSTIVYPGTHGFGLRLQKFVNGCGSGPVPLRREMHIIAVIRQNAAFRQVLQIRAQIDIANTRGHCLQITSHPRG